MTTAFRWLPHAIIAADIALILAAAVQVRELPLINNAIDIWFDRTDPAVQTLEQEQRLFGSDTWILATVWVPPDRVDETADVARTLTEQIERIDGVSRVVSPTNIEVLQREDEGLFFDRLDSRASWRELRGELLKHPIASQFLVHSQSPDVFSLLIKERTGLSAGDERPRLVGEIRRVFDGHPSVAASALSGTAVINASLNTLSWRDFRLVTPATLVLVSLVLLALLRFRVRTTLAILAPVGLTMAGLAAAMLLLRRPFTMVTIALPGLILALGMASGLHVIGWIANWLREQRGSGADMPRVAARHLARPLVVSELTTALGFGLIAVIPVTPVQEMALFGAAGVLYSGLHVLLVIPACLVWFRATGELTGSPTLFAGERWGVRRLDALTQRLSALRPARSRLMLAMTVACIGMGWLISNVVYDSTYLNMVAPSERLSRDYARFAAAGLPSSQVSVLISRDDDAKLIDAVLNEAVRRATADIEALPVVSKVLGPAAVFDEVAPSLAGDEPLTRFASDDSSVVDAYVFALSGGNSEIGSYVHEGLGAVRLVVLFPYLSNAELGELSRQISAILRNRFGSMPGVAAKVSGVTVLWANMDDAISRGQVTSILSMIAAMFISFFLSLRNWRVAATSTFVNVLPVMAIGALLGATRHPIDVATVFIMGITLGIADDDTSFTVHECADRAAEGQGGVAATIRHTGPRTVAACLVIVIGFSILLLSSFTPIRTFGGLTALGLVLAMICDVVILPFLLLAFPAAAQNVEDAQAVGSRSRFVRARRNARSS